MYRQILTEKILTSYKAHVGMTHDVVPLDQNCDFTVEQMQLTTKAAGLLKMFTKGSRISIFCRQSIINDV